MENTCVCCGREIPEGFQTCLPCQAEALNKAFISAGISAQIAEESMKEFSDLARENIPTKI